MNERIRELAEQTGFRYDNGEWQFGDDSDVQKFAELILRECLAQVFYYEEDEINDRITPSMHKRIKEHFGVEE